MTVNASGYSDDRRKPLMIPDYPILVKGCSVKMSKSHSRHSVLQRHADGIKMDTNSLILLPLGSGISTPPFQSKWILSLPDQ